MAFWSGAKLADQGDALNIVDPFDKGQVDCSAYTLRLGAEVYVTPSHGLDLRKNRKKKLKPASDVTVLDKIFKRRGDTVVIPPGQFAFLLTEEAVNIPHNAMGFLSLKSGIKFKGLINVSGFHVDPGFVGHLIYSVFNAGPSPIHLARGDDLFLLWIADLDGPIDDGFIKKNNNPQVEIPSRLISDVARETHSLQALSERVEQLAHRVTIFTTVAIVVSTLAALFIGYLQWTGDAPKANGTTEAAPQHKADKNT